MAEVIATLIEGARTFRSTEYLGNRRVMPGLALGQRPKVMMIGCADSRVDPGLICGAGPGELFLVRNVANLVPPYHAGDGRGDGIRAALEYGIRALGVSHIVVLGHAGCGGVGAMIDMASGTPLDLDCVRRWVGVADTVCDAVLGELAREGAPGVTTAGLRAHTPLVERRSILNSLDNLRSYPWVRARHDAGTLTLHGWWFNLQDGRLWVADRKTGSFAPVEGG